jgi:hypothetical protein
VKQEVTKEQEDKQETAINLDGLTAKQRKNLKKK